MDYRYGSHTVFKIEYHFVWVTKYRIDFKFQGKANAQTGNGCAF